jgi:hypothetical protein
VTELSWTIFGLTFFESNNVAHGRRKLCRVKLEKPARLRSALKPWW